MRLPVDAGFRLFALGLTTAALAGCGLIGGTDHPRTTAAIQPASSGPAADYPMVLGQPFTVDGELYTPADTLNYDVVGYAAIDEGSGVTLAHRTLPLPSYVEVTSLATGKTILARVERRGPMTGSQFVALSPAAAAQIGASDGGAVRVRRVNPPEQDRAELRAGRPAPERMETPKSLVEVLRRKLPATGAASLRAGVQPKAAAAEAMPVPASVAVPAVALGIAEVKPAPARAVVAAATPSADPKPTGAFPLMPLAGTANPVKPIVVARDETVPAAPAPVAKAVVKPDPAPAASVGEGFIVQAGTFSVRENAQKVAEALGGYISPTGKFFRVRTGPFTSRGQAEAALAKVRAAGYSDARVYSAG